MFAPCESNMILQELRGRRVVRKARDHTCAAGVKLVSTQVEDPYVGSLLGLRARIGACCSSPPAFPGPSTSEVELACLLPET